MRTFIKLGLIACLFAHVRAQDPLRDSLPADTSLGTQEQPEPAATPSASATDSLIDTATNAVAPPEEPPPPSPAAAGKEAPAQATINLDRAVIKAKRKQTEVEKLKTSGFAVNAVDLAQHQNTSADLNTVLSRTAGVKVRQSGGMGSGFEFSINGLSGKQVRYFIDGVPMDVFGSSMTLNNIPVNLAERVEVYKGVVPISLGTDVLGGAVNVVSNHKVKRYLDASYSYGSFNTHRAALSGQYALDRAGLVVKADVFHNYSDNNYLMKGVEIWDEGKHDYVEKDLERFHDAYRSSAARLEAGVVGRNWADALFIGGTVGSTKKDVQTGFRQNIVYGKVGEESESYNGTLRYRKDSLFFDGLDVNLFGAMANEETVITDTAARQYSWDGTGISRGSAEGGGIRSINHIIRPNELLRINANYRLAENHSVNVNSTLNQVRNETYNELADEDDATPGRMLKAVSGAAYQADWLSRELTSQIFVKDYAMYLEQEQYSAILHKMVAKDIVFHSFGYGLALRYKLFQRAGIKASYEHTYRLQETEEMFGNGLDLYGNPLLGPEYSDNFNLGLYHEFRKSGHRLFLEADGFLRDAHDFIYAVPYESSRIMQYENKGSVEVKGAEGEVNYAHARWLNLGANATWQNAVNTTKYSRPGQTVADVTYLNRMPNRPWFFGNLNVGLGKENVLGQGNRLQFNWNGQYVHWFYLTWEAFGDKRGKAVIPTQFIQDASVTYSLKDENFNVSLECNNLADALAFDDFRLQKPGRSFYAKLRYFIR